MRWVHNECVSCGYDGAEILRPQHFVAVCELMSKHDDILSMGELRKTYSTVKQGCPQDAKSQDQDETKTVNLQDRDETEMFHFSNSQDRDETRH